MGCRVHCRSGNKWHYNAAVKQYKCHASIFGSIVYYESLGTVAIDLVDSTCFNQQYIMQIHKNSEVLQKSLRYIINFNNHNYYSVHNYYSIAQFVFQSQYTAYEQQLLSNQSI